MTPDSPAPVPPQSPYVLPESVGREDSRTPRKRSGGCGLVLFFLVLAGLGGSVLLNLTLLTTGYSLDSERRVREKFHSRNRAGTEKVAIISVSGVIYGSGEDGFVKRQIEQAAKDKSVKAIVLRVDSPGGAVSTSHYYYHHLKKLVDESHLPMVVSMGGVAASGGYYVSMAAGPTPDNIFAEPTTWTGSIGVIIPHYNLGGLMEIWKIKEESVVSDRLKNMGTLSRAMTGEELKIFQALVDESFTRFKDIIKQSRPRFQQHPEALDKMATGQVFTAEQARQGGLVDRIGFVEDAIERAIELAGLDPERVRVVKYEPEAGLLDLLLGLEARGPGLDLSALLDQSAPRAYYLSTRMPLSISNSRRQAAP